MKTPLISIIIPVYNRVALIKETLDSVLAQSYPNWECIVVDDGSSDNTWGVLIEYQKKDRRIRICKRDREPKGAPTCRNIGMDLAEGDYFMFLDSDDLLGRKCIEFRVYHTQMHPDFSALIFPTKIFDKEINDSDLFWNKIQTATPDIIRFLNFDMPWHTSGPLWKKEMKETISFDETAKSMQDWEMHIRVLLKSINYVKIEETDGNNLTHYRKDPLIASIGSNYYNPEKLAARIITFTSICRLIRHSINDRNTMLALNRLLIRMAGKYSEQGLNRQVDVFTEYFIWSIERNLVVRVLIKLYFQRKFNGKSTKWIEVILYRIFKKRSLFEPMKGYFMNFQY